MSKVAIVTGASRGIGYEICKVLADEKHHAVAVARSENLLNELEQTNHQFIHAIPTDLTDQNAVNDLVRDIKSNFSGVDILRHTNQ